MKKRVFFIATMMILMAVSAFGQSAKKVLQSRDGVC